MTISPLECSICLENIEQRDAYSIDFFTSTIKYPNREEISIKDLRFIEISKKHLSEGIWQTSCEHVMHSRCIVKWLNNQSTCPICRKDLTEEIRGRIQIEGRVVCPASIFVDMERHIEEMQDHHIHLANSEIGQHVLKEAFQREIYPNFWEMCFYRAIILQERGFVELAMAQCNFNGNTLGTALMIALKHSFGDLFSLLIQKKTIYPSKLSEAFMYALQSGQINFAKAIFHWHGLQFLLESQRGEALCIVAEAGAFDFCEQIVKRSCSELDRRRACIAALKKGYLDSAKIIFENTTFRTKKAVFEIFLAAIEKDFFSFAKIILEKHELADDVREKAFCALVGKGSKEMINDLLAKGPFSPKNTSFLALFCIKHAYLDYALHFLGGTLHPIYYGKVLIAILESPNFSFFEDRAVFRNLMNQEFYQKKEEALILEAAIRHKRDGVALELLGQRKFSPGQFLAFKKLCMESQNDILYRVLCAYSEKRR